MRVLAAAALATAILPASPAAAAITVATFLAKAEGLKAKGIAALFSSDLKLIKSEVATAMRDLQLEGAARKKAGLPSRACPPKGNKMDSDEFLSEMRMIPVADQRTWPLKDGILFVLRRKYPCR